MKKSASAAALMLFALAASSQELLQCANPDVLNGLVFRGRSDAKMTVTRAMPKEMPGMRAPAGFELIGTGVRPAGDWSTAFKTALAADKAMAALTDALATDGWSIEARQSPPETFNVSGQPQASIVCRNGERRSLSVQDMGTTRYARMQAVTDQRARACNTEDPRLRGTDMFTNAARDMPRLDFPATSHSTSMDATPGGGGPDSYSTASRIQSPDSAAGLAAHFAAQLAKQGWRQDGAWSGARSAGSTWTRIASDGQPAWGMLEILGISRGVYEAGFTLTRKPL